MCVVSYDLELRQVSEHGNATMDTDDSVTLHAPMNPEVSTVLNVFSAGVGRNFGLDDRSAERLAEAIVQAVGVLASAGNDPADEVVVRLVSEPDAVRAAISPRSSDPAWSGTDPSPDGRSSGGPSDAFTASDVRHLRVPRTR